MTSPSSRFSKIIKKSSRTFFWASLFFPKNIRDQVFDFYAFVRTVDDLVDSSPPKTKEFYRIKNLTLLAFSQGKTADPLIGRLLEIAKKNNISKRIFAAFFHSQQLDFKKKQYRSFQELEQFIYGVAEIIGLCMAKILRLPQQSYPSARRLGKAMQLINCIRDIEEDRLNGKLYLPIADLKRFHLTPNNYYLPTHRRSVYRLIRFELTRALKYDKQARRGFRYIPKRYRLAVATAADLYRWTALKIYRQPETVFKRQLKPTLFTIISITLVNLLRLYAIDSGN